LEGLSSRLSFVVDEPVSAGDNVGHGPRRFRGPQSAFVELLTCNCMVASAQSDVAVERLRDWLYCLRTPMVQAYAIVQSDGFVLVDSGIAGYEQAYLEALAEVAGTPVKDVRITEILLTHGHDDHTGSAAALVSLTGARVRGPALDAKVIEGRAVRAEPQLSDWELLLFEKLSKAPPRAPAVILDEHITDGDHLGWERPARVVAAPGHTVGSIAVFLPDDHVLIAGDAIASIAGEPIVGVFNVDPAQAQESVRRLGELDIDLVCFGHGEPITEHARSRIAGIAGPHKLPQRVLTALESL
jgi:glyoxylase-like metal-dependent hydrolase (beta-lactamase superfamily II)